MKNGKFPPYYNKKMQSFTVHSNSGHSLIRYKKKTKLNRQEKPAQSNKPAKGRSIVRSSRQQNQNTMTANPLPKKKAATRTRKEFERMDSLFNELALLDSN